MTPQGTAIPGNPYYEGTKNQATSGPPHERETMGLFRRLSWSAIFAGLVIAFAVQMILNLAGMGIGFAVLDATDNPAGAGYEFSWGAAIWWMIAGVIASYAGGYAAGKLCGETAPMACGWHGLTSWATSILVVGFILASAAGGTAASVNSPFQIVMDRQVATISAERGIETAPATTTTRTATNGSAANNVSPSAGTDVNAISSDTLSAAALASAVALILGGVAAWYGGRAGTARLEGRPQHVNVRA
ncbi:MAG: hypothetical protein L6Q57_04110 [Alphaproteobacteria bacterium]|nr:hypothetical protein [Alphaproteobacteria bacterium]